MNDKLKTLQAILDNCGFDFVHVNDYDFTQPDSMDESDSGGVWDLAGTIADWCCGGCSGGDTDTDEYDKINSYLQSLLYNLMCDYKDEHECCDWCGKSFPVREMLPQKSSGEYFCCEQCEKQYKLEHTVAE